MRSGIDEAHLRETLRQDTADAAAYLDQRFSAVGEIAGTDAVDDWMASLRRRGGVVDLYLSGR